MRLDVDLAVSGMGMPKIGAFMAYDDELWIVEAIEPRAGTLYRLLGLFYTIEPIAITLVLRSATSEEEGAELAKRREMFPSLYKAGDTVVMGEPRRWWEFWR